MQMNYFLAYIYRRANTCFHIHFYSASILILLLGGIPGHFFQTIKMSCISFTCKSGSSAPTLTQTYFQTFFRYIGPSSIGVSSKCNMVVDKIIFSSVKNNSHLPRLFMKCHHRIFDLDDQMYAVADPEHRFVGRESRIYKLLIFFVLLHMKIRWKCQFFLIFPSFLLGEMEWEVFPLIDPPLTGCDTPNQHLEKNEYVITFMLKVSYHFF